MASPTHDLEAARTQLEAAISQHTDRVTRGRTLLKKLTKLRDKGLKHPIEFADGCLVKPHKKTFVNIVGITVRTKVPITITNFRKARKTYEDIIWDDVKVIKDSYYYWHYIHFWIVWHCVYVVGYLWGWRLPRDKGLCPFEIWLVVEKVPFRSHHPVPLRRCRQRRPYST